MSAPPRALLRLEVAHERRHRLGGVAAGEEDDVGVLEILEREGEPAVEPERLVRGRRARRHAVAAVVVDVGGADGDAGELAEEVGLLVGQRAAAEDADGIGAMRADRVADAERDAIEGVAPPDRHQAAGAIAGQRLAQPLGMVDDGGGVPPLGAERAGVDRKGAVADHRERRRRARDDAALQRAVGAMRLDDVDGGGRGHAVPPLCKMPSGRACQRQIRLETPVLLGKQRAAARTGRSGRRLQTRTRMSSGRAAGHGNV